MKPGSPPKILVVDDDPSIVDCVRQVLGEAGYTVDAVTDSNGALERITARPGRYGILISDNSMPHLSGSQLIGQARTAGFKGRVIVYSGSVSPDDEAEFKALGADVVLRKPFDLKMLVPVIADLCASDHDGGKPKG